MGNKGKGGLLACFCCAVVLLACAPVTERAQPGEPALVRGPDYVRTDDEIQAVFDQNKSKLYSIYQRALRNDPTIKGRIVLSITIEPSGQVSECKVHQTNIKVPALRKRFVARYTPLILA
jgi:hypothetical protein